MSYNHIQKDVVVVPILQMGKLGVREVKKLTVVMH